jgi:hypothetical protein
MYAIIIASSLSTVAAHAQIVYTDVNPDMTILNGSYNLDLNNDGTTDFSLKSEVELLHCKCGFHLTDGGNWWAGTVRLNAENMIAHDKSGDILIAQLDINTIIDSSLSWGSGRGTLISDPGSCIYCGLTSGKIYTASERIGLWANSANEYMGLQLKIGSNIYYGWQGWMSGKMVLSYP